MTHLERPRHPKWMSTVLRLAAAYNILWGAAVVLFPNVFFDIAGLARPLYVPIWQCIGMIVGVYGIGYAIAARDPARHWPIVLVGLLGKVFGPIGFAWSLMQGTFPPSFALVILFNDLIWWWPFAAILWYAAHENQRPAVSSERRLEDQGDGISVALGVAEAMQAAQLSNSRSGERSLFEVSFERPHLVVFLRHLGCTFCREALDDVRVQRAAIEGAGVGVILVHMSDDASARELFTRYDLQEVPRISDPEAQLYQAFQLRRGSPLALFGPKVWWRGLVATVRGHRVGGLQGDGFQMPGAFIVHRGQIATAFRHATAADRPDYASMSCSLPPAEWGAGERRPGAGNERGEGLLVSPPVPPSAA